MRRWARPGPSLRQFDGLRRATYRRRSRRTRPSSVCVPPPKKPLGAGGISDRTRCLTVSTVLDIGTMPPPDPYTPFRKALAVGTPPAAVAARIRSAGLDPGQIPSLASFAADAASPSTTGVAAQGKELLKLAFKPRPQALATTTTTTTTPAPKKWVVKTEAELPPLDLARARPFPLAPRDWEGCVRSVERSEKGATGVFFVLCESSNLNGVVVLKRVADLSSALYEGWVNGGGGTGAQLTPSLTPSLPPSLPPSLTHSLTHP